MPYRSTFDRVFLIEVAIAAAVFTVVVVLLVVALVRGRRGEPSQRSERKALEWAYVVGLIGVAGFLTWTSLSANADEHRASARPELVVRVTAFQWCWRFEYPTQRISVSGTCSGRAGRPTLVVPTGTKVQVDVTSADVVHEFWIPSLRNKVEALPNWTTSMTFSLPSPGTWIGRCSEFCGLLHDQMDFWLHAVSPAEYRQWVQAHSGSATA